MHNILARLWAPIGLWRTNLLLRGWGFSLTVALLYGYNHTYVRLAGADARAFFTLSPEVIAHYWTNTPPSYVLVGLAGLLMLLVGPRLLTLLFALVTSAFAFAHVVTSPLAFPTANWPWRFLIPLMVTIFLCCSKRDRKTFDNVTVTFFRWAFAIIVFFVTFHKYNADHFAAELSCGATIIGFFESAWGPIGQLIAAHTPVYMGLVIEGVIFASIFFAPWLTPIVTTALLSVFALSGAAAVASLVIFCSLSLLRHEHIHVLRDRQRTIVQHIALVLTTSCLITIGVYRSHVLSWQELFLIQAAAVSIVVCMLHILQHESRSAGRNFISHALWHPRALFSLRTLEQPLRGILAGAIIVALINCLSPYLGLKYHYSLSMWSNLRADSFRWNHYLVPQWVQIVDPMKHYVHVTSVNLHEVPINKANDLLSSQFDLQRYFYPFQGDRTNLDINFSFGGQRYDAQDAWMQPEFTSMLPTIYDTISPENPLYIHALHARLHTERWARRTAENTLEPALFETGAFQRLINETKSLPVQFDISVQYRGTTHTFRNASHDPALTRLVQGFTSRPWLQYKLTAGEPQWCTH